MLHIYQECYAFCSFCIRVGAFRKTMPDVDFISMVISKRSHNEKLQISMRQRPRSHIYVGIMYKNTRR